MCATNAPLTSPGERASDRGHLGSTRAGGRQSPVLVQNCLETLRSIYPLGSHSAVSTPLGRQTTEAILVPLGACSETHPL